MIYDIIPRHHLYQKMDYLLPPPPKTPAAPSREIAALASLSLITAVIIASLIISTTGPAIAGWQ